MATMWERFEKFKELKLSQIVEGRKQDLLTWIHGHPPGPVDPDATEAVPKKFSFNTRLLSPYFRDMSTNNTYFPFIEFPTIGLIKVPNGTDPTQLPALIDDFLNKRGPYQNVEGDYLNLPLIIQINGQYYFYGNTKGNAWAITRLDPTIIAARRLPIVETPYKLEFDLQNISIYQHIIENKAHTHFSTQPQQVLQLKKLINSTFYIKALLVEFEGIHFSWSGLYQFGDTVRKYFNGTTYSNIYHAITLLANTEIDYAHQFKDEVVEILNLIERFKRYSTWKKEEIPANTYKPTWSFQAGQAAGFTTRYIYDPNGQWDVDVISQFSADLPRHLDMLTTLINSNHSSITQYTPNINAGQLRALQKEATQLLKTLKSTQRLSKSSKFNLLYQMYQIINYAFLIRQILVLLSTTLTQVGQLNDAYQEALRDILKLIKEECLPLLWKYAAHAEVEFMLEPGTLTQPTLELINSFHDFLAQRVKSLGDFKFLGENLLIVEDSKFLSQCDEAIQDMYHEAEQTKEQILLAQQFFTLLESGTTNAAVLEKHYVWLTVYAGQKFDLATDRLIANELKKTGIPFNPPPEIIRTMRYHLFPHLEKLYNTADLRSQQCQAVRASIPQFTNLNIFPYQERMGCDISLKIVDDIPLAQLKLSTEYPILIQHRVGTETKYTFYGNTDGRKWGFTPIAEAFIHGGLLDHFKTIRQRINGNPAERNKLHLLTYRPKYESLYSQMILKQAHTYYKSPLSSFESEALNVNRQNLTQWIFKPIDWAERTWTNQSNALTVEPSNNLATTAINDFHAYYSDLTQLSAEQALKLRSWYQQKTHAYHEAIKNIAAFKSLINQNFPSGLLQFSHEQKDLQKQCLYLYHSIRPYCITMQNFPEFDHKMVQTLSTTISSITRAEFNQRMGRFTLNERNLIAAWTRRANELSEYAQKKLKNEQDLARMNRHDNVVADRAEHLLSTTKLSTKIKELKESLSLWLPVLNPIIQAQLNPSARGVPYPDILDMNDRQRHPAFVLFFKRAFNLVYYLENLAEGLEKIRTGDSEAIKNETIELIKNLSLSHGQGLFDIILQLKDDQVLNILGNDLWNQSQKIIDYVCTLIQPHTADVQKVHPQGKQVTYSGLWYAMNSFYTLPRHLLNLTEQDEGDHNFGYRMALHIETNATLTVPTLPRLTLIKHNNRYYLYSNGKGNDWKLRNVPKELIDLLDIDFSKTQMDYHHHLQPLYDYLIQNESHHTSLNTLQISAKLATQNIETIIQDSNSYFKLFFDGMMIYRLNQNLQKQVKEFTRTTQEVVMSHLQILENEYFADLVIKADTKEHEWGLNPGTLTEPLGAVLSELFQGLIFPLKKTFLEKEAFCTTDAILRARILAEEERFAKLSAVDEELIHDLGLFYRFTEGLNHFKAQYEAAWSKPQIPSEFREVYTEQICHKLHDYRNSFIPKWITIIPSDLVRDSLKNIQVQVTELHSRMSRMALLHNTEQKSFCEALPIFLRNLKTVENSDLGQEIPADLINQYATQIRPQLHEHRNSYFPSWIADISTHLHPDSMEKVLAQTKTFYAHLLGVENTRHLHKGLSEQKLRYLNNKLEDHNAHSRLRYRLSFAKHHFHTYLNRLPYQSVGLEGEKIRKEYRRELAKYLLQYETECLHNIETHDDIDKYIEQKLEEKIQAFKQQHFERFRRLDRVQKAINEFNNYLYNDTQLPTTLRNKKLECIKTFEAIIYQDPQQNTLDEFLNIRMQQLHTRINSPASEAILLEKHEQSYTLLQWLVSCFMALLEAIGFASDRQKHYSNLVKATKPQTQDLPTGWSRYSVFRSDLSSPQRTRQIATPAQTPVIPR